MDDHDSEKRFAGRYAKYFEIFSVVDGKDLCINSFSDFKESKAVNIGFKVPENGTYTISLKSIENFNGYVSVKLEDHSTQPSKLIDLSTEDYTTNFLQGFNKERFTLHLIARDVVTGVKGKNEAKSLIYSNNNQIYIDIPELTEPMYHLYTVGGQLIKKGELRSGVLNVINSSADGIVIVKVSAKEKTLSEKVFVKQ